MRKLMIAASAAALLGAVSMASAAEITGAIQAIDPGAGTVTLDNGQTFNLSADLAAAFDAWKVGDKVKLTYDGSGAAMTVTAVEAAPVLEN